MEIEQGLYEHLMSGADGLPKASVYFDIADSDAEKPYTVLTVENSRVYPGGQGRYTSCKLYHCAGNAYELFGNLTLYNRYFDGFQGDLNGIYADSCSVHDMMILDSNNIHSHFGSLVLELSAL